MKVLFIYPSFNCHFGINSGLASLSGVLKANGHEARLVHLRGRGLTREQIMDTAACVRSYKPDLIGFSAISQQYKWCLAIGRELKNEFSAPFVIGGVHCTLNAREVIADNIWDYLCVGEGEMALLELANRLERRLDTSSLPNMYTRQKGDVRKFSSCTLPTLETLPPRDFELFDLKTILQNDGGWMRLTTSRGCPNVCSYCLNDSIANVYTREKCIKNKGKYLRYHSIAYVLDELMRLKEQHHEITMFNFDDDLFTMDRERVIRFARAYHESGIGVPYVINAHVQYMDEEIADHLKASGCRIVRFGVESGSEKIRKDILKRNVSDIQIKKAFEIIHARGIHSSAFIMLGIPHETPEDILATIRLCADLQVGRFRWSFLFPYPGTEMYSIAEAAGLIDHKKMAELDNYFEKSCLTFGPERDLYLEKLGRVFNWYVNAHTGWPSASLYRGLVNEVDKMDRESWDKYCSAIWGIDKKLSDELTQTRSRHYTIQYQDVIGIDSNYIESEREAQLTHGAPGVRYDLK